MPQLSYHNGLVAPQDTGPLGKHGYEGTKSESNPE